MHTPIESKSQERTLTTTSFAVLSVLSLRDHSTYDLIRQMRLTMHYMWPRAESNVYAEPRRLVEAGLATARTEWNGQRRRTIYSITEAGRAALAEWIASPSARPRYECEALVKVLFAENGTRDQMLAAIHGLAEDATGALRHFRGIAERYAANEGEYPWRFGLSALALRLLAEQQAATLRWATWAEQVVAGWESPLAADAAWGVESLRATGEPFPMEEDPVRQIERDTEGGLPR
jgi:DNA-binding PadR family transcriptional regulator